MRTQRPILLTCISALLLGLAPGAFAKDELPEVTEDGLHRVHDAKLAIVYAQPGASLAQYRQIWMLEPYVAFKKNWEREQRSQSADPMRLTSKDIENIKKNLAAEFQKVFSATLVEGGYPVTDAAGEDVLLLRPAIINLDVNAPDTPRSSFSRTYTASAGEMTLYVELYDSVTGDLLAKALDAQADNAYANHYTWTNSVTNRAAADRILKGWATILLNALNQAKAGGEPAPAEQ